MHCASLLIISLSVIGSLSVPVPDTRKFLFFYLTMNDSSSLPLLYATFFVGNGHNAPPDSYPWHLSLFTSKGVDLYTCGASLLRVPYMTDKSDMAVTAAHCLDVVSACEGEGDAIEQGLFTIVAGNHSLRNPIIAQGEVVEKVVAAAVHEQWDTCSEVLTGDIAVIKLATPLHFSKTIQPIDLPEKNEATPSDCSLGGWGLTKNEVIENDSGFQIIKTLPKKLQELKIHFTEADNCNKTLYEKAATHSKWFICDRVGKNTGKVLQGDSGSGLVCGGTDDQSTRLYGITSHMIPSLKVDVYTKVSFVVDWINQAVDKLRQTNLK